MARAEFTRHSPTSTFSSFPQNLEEFDADPRVSFSKLDKKFILETENNEEFEFDDGLKRWVPVVRPRPFAHEGSKTVAHAKIA